MWAENGLTYFSIYNKTDHPMYIDWKRSVFIYNSWKNEYWVEKSTTESYLIPSGSGKNITYSNKVSTVVSERITFIPPHTYISVPMTYRIISSLAQISTESTGDNKMTMYITDNLKMDKAATKVKIPKSTGKGTVTAYEKAYTAENSPYQFRNYLTYSSDEKFSTEKHIENAFYVKKHTQMSSKNFFGKKTKVKVKINKKSSGKVNIYDSPYRSGTSFYKTVTI